MIDKPTPIVNKKQKIGIRRCGWCNEPMGLAPGIEGETTGICEICLPLMKRALEIFGQEKQK